MSLKTTFAWCESRHHCGVILDVARGGFDGGSASFGSVFSDEDHDKLFLFYTGASDVKWSRSAIGLASSKDGLEFKRISKVPILEGNPKSFCYVHAMAPVVTRIENRFYMILSGKPSPKSFRRIGIAYSEDLEGPWHVIGELIKPSRLWEGTNIDNGPSIVKLNHDTILAFYSNITSWKRYDIFARWRRYPIRRIGIIKIRIRGTSRSSIEVHRFSGNPLKHLNGPRGSWNESLFCPGYFQLQNIHYLLPSASIYSVGFPYRQYIGVVASNSPYFPKSESYIQKLLDGPSEKKLLMSNIKGEIALDWAAPFLKEDEGRLFLYYSAMDRADQKWKTALTTFDLQDHMAKSQKVSAKQMIGRNH